MKRERGLTDSDTRAQSSWECCLNEARNKADRRLPSAARMMSQRMRRLPREEGMGNSDRHGRGGWYTFQDDGVG